MRVLPCMDANSRLTSINVVVQTFTTGLAPRSWVRRDEIVKARLVVFVFVVDHCKPALCVQCVRPGYPRAAQIEMRRAMKRPELPPVPERVLFATRPSGEDGCLQTARASNSRTASHQPELA